MIFVVEKNKQFYYIDFHKIHDKKKDSRKFAFSFKVTIGRFKYLPKQFL